MIGPLDVNRTASASSNIMGDNTISDTSAIVTLRARTERPFRGRDRRSRKTGMSIAGADGAVE
jgi:hypothetical protein